MDFCEVREKSQSHLAKNGACNRPRVGFPCRRFRYFLLLRRVSFFSWRKKAAQMRKAGRQKWWEGSGLRSACRHTTFWKPLGFNKLPSKRWRWGFNNVQHVSRKGALGFHGGPCFVWPSTHGAIAAQQCALHQSCSGDGKCGVSCGWIGLSWNESSGAVCRRQCSSRSTLHDIPAFCKHLTTKCNSSLKTVQFWKYF